MLPQPAVLPNLPFPFFRWEKWVKGIFYVADLGGSVVRTGQEYALTHLQPHLAFLLALLGNEAAVSAEWLRTFQAAWISGDGSGVSLLLYLLLLFKRELDFGLKIANMETSPLPSLSLHFCAPFLLFSCSPLWLANVQGDVFRESPWRCSASVGKSTYQPVGRVFQVWLNCRRATN